MVALPSQLLINQKKDAAVVQNRKTEKEKRVAYTFLLILCTEPAVDVLYTKIVEIIYLSSCNVSFLT